MFSNLLKYGDPKTPKVSNFENQQFFKQVTPQKYSVNQDHLKAQKTVKRYSPNIISQSKRIKTLEENNNLTLNAEFLKYDLSINVQPIFALSLNQKQHVTAQTDKHLDRGEFQRSNKYQLQESNGQIKNYTKLSNKNKLQSFNLNNLSPHYVVDHLPQITPKSSKLANILGNKFKPSRQEEDSLQRYNPRNSFEDREVDFGYRFYTPQKMRDELKSKSVSPQPQDQYLKDQNKVAIASYKVALTEKQLKEKSLKNQYTIKENLSNGTRTNIPSIRDSLNIKTIKKRNTTVTDDQIISARIPSPKVQLTPIPQRTTYIYNHLKKSKFEIEEMQTQSRQYEELYFKLKNVSEQKEKSTENVQKPSYKTNSIKPKIEQRNYLHQRNNTQHYYAEKTLNLSPYTHRMTEFSFEEQIVKDAINQYLPGKLVTDNSRQIKQSYESFSEKAILELKMQSLNFKDILLTQIFNVSEKEDKQSLKLLEDYLHSFDAQTYNELLVLYNLKKKSHIKIERYRYLVKLSLTYEWIALTIYTLLKLGMLKSKSLTEQVRFGKIIQANHIIMMKTLYEELEIVKQLISKIFYQKKQNPMLADIVTLGKNYLDQKQNTFYFLNQNISTNLAQLNTLLSYTSESIVIMNINDKLLQEKSREYFKLRVDVTELQVFISIIKDTFLKEMKKFIDTKVKSPVPRSPKSKTKSQSPNPSGSPAKLKPPFLPPFLHNQPYTLVVDLDETLVHFQEQGQNKHILVRPYVETFLKEMSKYYELVIFTAGLENYANWVLDQIDPQKYIKHRLYRQHTQFIQEDNSYLKDLGRLGRPLDKTIIIDNTPQNFSCNPQNGIQIRSWFTDPSDTALTDIIPTLKYIREKNSDVREEMRSLKGKLKVHTSFFLPNC